MEESVKHKPLRILMTTDTVGGVWSYSMELCKSLHRFSVHFYLITTGAPIQPAQKDEVRRLENVTVYETDFLLEWMENPWKSIDVAGPWILQLEEELKPDIIHLNCYSYGALSFKAPVVMVTHSDVYSWWIAVNNGRPPAEWNEYYKRVKRGLERADFIIAPSAAMMSSARNIYGISTAGKVLYNGRSADAFYVAQKQDTIFSMGRIWDEGKNIRLLVDAAMHLRYPVKLAGASSFAGNSSAISGANISCLGKISPREVAEQLSVASVYVLPAKYEPFGLSVLEAALSGCALVLGDIASLREIWNDSACYVDTNDARALAAAVNQLMENEGLRLNYVQKSLERAKIYSLEAMVTNYIGVYKELLLKKKTANVF